MFELRSKFKTIAFKKETCSHTLPIFVVLKSGEMNEENRNSD